MADRVVNTRITATDETQGPIDTATANLKSFKRSVEDLAAPFELLKGILAGLLANVVGEFFKKTVEAAVAAEAAWARVNSALENAGIGAKGVHGELETLFESMTKTTRFSERELADAFATLLNVSNDYKGSLQNLGLVANIAVARQMDLSAAATLVGRVMDGNTSMLKRYGIVLKEDGIDPMDQLRQRFNDFATKDAETLGGGLARIVNAFEKIQEAIGKAITGGGGSGQGIAGFAERLNNLAEWIESHQSVFDRLERLFNLFNRIQTSGIEVFSPFAHWMNTITGTQPETQENISVAEWAKSAREVAANARQVAADREQAELKKEIAALKAQLEELHAEPLDMDALQHRVSTGPVVTDPATGITTGGLVKVGKGLDAPGPGAVTNQLSTGGLLAKLGEEMSKLISLADPKISPVKVVDLFKVDIPNAVDISTQSVQKMATLWGSAIQAIIEHHKSLGKAIVDTGRQAIGQVLVAQGQAALLKAGEAAAEGLWPPNPVLLTKAAELLGIGTAEIALGSLLGGGGSSGSSSSSSYAGGSSVGSAFAQTSGVAGGAVNITLPFEKFVLDATDPDTRAQFAAIISKLFGNREIILDPSGG